MAQSIQQRERTKSDDQRPKSRGVVILKTISLLLVSSNSNQKATNQTKKVKENKKMEDNPNKINPRLIESLKKRTHFNKKELTVLFKMYRKLVADSHNHQVNRSGSSLSMASNYLRSSGTSEGIDRIIFRELMHSTFDISSEEMLIERCFTHWEKGNEGGPLQFEGWIIGLSIFLRGSLAERVAFCFSIYDLNSDGFITKDEMFTLMKNCLIKQPQDEDPDESVKDLMDIALRKFDVDKDGKISYQDYLSIVFDEPLLLEAFGQCLPSEAAVNTFISSLLAPT